MTDLGGSRREGQGQDLWTGLRAGRREGAASEPEVAVPGGD